MSLPPSRYRKRRAPCLIREAHERLMRSVRGDAGVAGEFRRSQNWIGPPGCSLSEAIYVPPSELMACLDPFERFLYDDSLPPLVYAGLAHAQFEAKHPFIDGNGRVGRLLITPLLVERAVLALYEQAEVLADEFDCTDARPRRLSPSLASASRSRRRSTSSAVISVRLACSA